MKKETELPNRKSIRMKGWDYTSPGCYFVTINTHAGKALFGVIVNGRMVLNEAGKIAEEEWKKSALIRKGIKLDEFVIMPNHMHGVLWLKGLDASSQGLDASSQGLDASSPYRPQFGKPVAGSLGTFVGAYKAAVTRAINRRGCRGLMHQARTTIWHRNYWDIIVHDKRALKNIRNYIRFNPQNYDVVMNCGEPHLLGNAALLDMPKMGFLASRGAPELHNHLPLKPDEVILSGFLSPMERAVFKAWREHKRPMIWVKPWGLNREVLTHHHRNLTRQSRTAISEDRLLIVSPFADSIEAPSVRRAAWCNQYVLAKCERMVVGHLNPGGMLACVLSELNPERELIYL